jgi:chromosome partitioning protein
MISPVGSGSNRGRAGEAMKVIALTSRKGGAGKSTIACHLSVLADQEAPPALLVDLDPQRSATLWHSLREAETPLLIAGKPDELPKIIGAAERGGVEWIILDTPPHETAGLAVTMRHADLILIPTKPAPFDLAAAAATVTMGRELRKPMLAILNGGPPKRGALEASLLTEARKVLAALGVPVWDGALASRAAYMHALTIGASVSEFAPGETADFEITALWRSVKHLTGKLSHAA